MSNAPDGVSATERARQLAETTVLSDREADVWALKERGLSHAEVADELDLSRSTVGEYVRRVKEKRRRAATTVAEIPAPE